jgi:hypothetical protein
MADLRRILEAREPFYAQSHAIIDTAGSELEESFQQLAALLKNWGQKNWGQSKNSQSKLRIHVLD